MLWINLSMYPKVSLLVTLNSVRVTSQRLASVACYVSKQVDFSKLTVVELNAQSLTKCKPDYILGDNIMKISSNWNPYLDHK